MVEHAKGARKPIVIERLDFRQKKAALEAESRKYGRMLSSFSYAKTLARRLLRCSERIPRRWACPVGNGVRVAFRVPARKRVKHAWTYWGRVSGQPRPALAAHHRLGSCRDGPDPIRAFVPALARGDSLGGDPFGVPG